MKSYSEYVVPYFKYFKIIKVPYNKVAIIESFVRKVIAAKKAEAHHIIDGGSEYKRFYTGILGEAALEELLGVEIIDWSIGKSTIYNKGDLIKIGLDLGIKTVEYGKFPIIHKEVKRPEIINIKTSEDMVAVCGLANINTLKEYQDESLILSSNLRQRGTKTGFYGFSKLKPFDNLENLKNTYMEI